MALLAKKRVLSVLMGAVIVWPACSWGRYEMSGVDYFQEKKQSRKPSVTTSNEWVEDPGHPPPKAVTDLLNDPGPATGKAYVQWNKARMEKIRRAQEAVDALESKESPKP